VVQQCCDRTQAVYKSTKDDNSTIHQEERFKGPEVTTPVWTHTTDDYRGQMPWARSGQGTDVEGTAEECNKVYRPFGPEGAHLVKPGAR